jgi:hypothetical protein
MSESAEGSSAFDTPSTDYDDAPASSDAMADVASSTEDLAAKESETAYRQDADSATMRDRVDEGRSHARSQGDRSETGGR